ncbi:MAG: hypothetical protein AAB893_03340, partial [Patescibacteria group bacterium]
MYKINRVNEENLSLLIQIFEAQLGKNSGRDNLLRRKIDNREGIYYILEEEEISLGYAHWIQDQKRDAWIRMQSIGILPREEKE